MKPTLSAMTSVWKPAPAALLVLLVCQVVGADAPSEDQIAKLTAAAWRDKPASVEVHAYRELMPTPLSQAQIRTMVEKTYSISDQDAVNKDGSKRQAEMDAEIQRIEKEQQAPRIMKQTIFVKGDLFRLDQTIASPGQQLNAETAATKTYVNAGDPSLGDHTHFDYDHVTQMATVFNEKQMWRRERIDEWPRVPDGARAVFQIFLGKRDIVNGQSTFVPDPAAIQEVVKGSKEGVQISVASVTKGSRELTQITTTLTRVSDKPAVVLLCDPEDYSRVYRYESYDPKSGRPMQVRECDEFDQDGFPRVVTTTRYAADGSVAETDRAVVQEASMDKPMPDELFAFNPPMGYAIVDRRLSQPVVINPQLLRPDKLIQQVTDEPVAAGPSVKAGQPLAETSGQAVNAQQASQTPGSEHQTQAVMGTSPTRSRSFTFVTVLLSVAGVAVAAYIIAMWKRRQPDASC